MFLLRVLMFPLSLLYDLITSIRNRLYDLGIKPSASFDIPTINVGNLSVGGTGKTPMIEYLIRMLKGKRVATLSRGYGRKTRGFRVASDEETALTLGDEPYQFYRKFGKDVVVTVGEDRVLAIPNLLQHDDNIDVVLLDDAFQHRRIKPRLNVLLTVYNHPFYKDVLLPAGRLREARRGARRADIVVVTKCPPGIREEEMNEVKRAISNYSDRPVFFTMVEYGKPVSFGKPGALQPNVVLLTGIADAAPLKKYVQDHFNLERHLEYPDHYEYKTKDLLQLKELSSNASIITTEKDMVRLSEPVHESILRELPVFYLPIEIRFVENGENFDVLIRQVISER